MATAPATAQCVVHAAFGKSRVRHLSNYLMKDPKSYGGDIICRPSRFLEDFSAELIVEWQVGNSDPWGDDKPF